MTPPVMITDLPARQLSSTRTGEPLTSVRSLSEACELKDLQVHQEILPPGCRASAPHHHTHKEEIFLVLSGHPTVWQDGIETPLAPGMCVGFPRGSRINRMLVNHTAEPAVFLTLGTNPPDDAVCYGPSNPDPSAPELR